MFKYLSIINNFKVKIQKKNIFSLLYQSYHKIFPRSRKDFYLLRRNTWKLRQQTMTTFESPLCLHDELFCKVSDKTYCENDKVTIVGAGNVGVACASAILFQKISSNVALVDAFPEKLKGEALDFCHGSVFLDSPSIEYDTDFCISSNSKVVLITAGGRQMNNESRLDLVQKNTEIIKKIVPPLVEYSPNAIFLVITNPVDILTWVTWRVSQLPVSRIIGSGCHLDTARFRYLIGQRLGIAPGSVHGFIIGEHGDSQLPLWSGVNVGGVLFRDIIPSIGLDLDETGWNKIIINEVTKAASVIQSLKDYSNTAIGLAAADITKDILRNTLNVKSVSTLVQGHLGVRHEIFLSLPCVVGQNGIDSVLRMRITEDERRLFQNSANIVYNVQKNLQVP